MRPVPQSCLDFIKGAEGLTLVAKRDSGGRWFYGYGHTRQDIREGDTITEAQADSFLFADATHAATQIALTCHDDRIQALGEHQYAALVSFAFNLGWSRVDCPTMIDLLNAGNCAAIPVQLMKYDKVKNVKTGVVSEIPGLINRRSAEVSLWKTADVDGAITIANSSSETPPPSFVTRGDATLATPDPTRPLTKQKSFVSGLIGTVGAGGLVVAQTVQGAGKSVADTLQPYVGQSEILQHLQGELTLVVAAAAVGTVFCLWLRQRAAKQS
jgi:GH24 family phage-related lysozyme (muramidase)